MKILTAILGLAAFFTIGSPALQAHERDRVTRVDRYHDEDVVHYDHHHRKVYVDHYGRVVGTRTRHHDHHYVAPRRPRHHDDSHRGGYRFFFRH